MAFSIQRAVSDGTMTLLPISIEYFDREEISVAFDGVLNARQWAWVGTTDKTLSFTPAVADTVEVVVVRSTDLSELRHQFSLGAQFTAESLDESLLQVLHIAQEATERQLGGDFFTHIDMHGSQITNLGAATAPDHAVTLAQYQADASGASAAKDTAVASASTAVSSSNSASASASAALLSANNAGVSESNALSSANSASASASTASTKATEAAASAAAALVSENASKLAESNAKASEVAAAASAASALHPWEAEAGGIHYDLGNVRIGGVGKRITGDFSNATIANRVMFQTSTVSSETLVGLCPTAYGVSTGVQFYNTPTPGSGINSIFDLRVVGTVDCRLQAMYEGSGTPLPMTFWTGGSERMRIDTNGNVGIGVSPNVNWGSGFKALELGYSGSVLSVNTINGNTAIRGNLYVNASSQSIHANTGFAAAVQVLPSSGIIQLITLPSASAGAVAAAAVASFQVSQTDCTMITPNGGLGYGTGAGGTVTQATSKSTAVTLNKPTGQITMNSEALAANTGVIFKVNNSLVSAADNIIVTLQAGMVSGGGAYNAWASGVGAGIFFINLKNISTVSLSESLVINFAIIKGATA